MSETEKVNVDPQKVKERIREEGRTRPWVAKQIGITTGYLNQILCGDRSPSRSVVILLAKTLNTTEEAFAKASTKARAS